MNVCIDRPVLSCRSANTYKARHVGIEMQTDKETDRETDRQTDRQTNRQTDRQAGMHACMHTYIHTYIHRGQDRRTMFNTSAVGKPDGHSEANS